MQSAKASLYMTKFQRSTSTPYTVVTPLTPLGDLEAFLAHNIFAISASPRPSTIEHDRLRPVATVVTDSERKFLLGVATSQDLEASSLASAATLVYLPETFAELREETWHILT